MKSLLIIIIAFCSSLTGFAYEGIVHGVKQKEGITEEFDIFIKGNKICVEGTNTEGYFKIIFDKGSDEVTICMDNPYFNGKSYLKVDLSQTPRPKTIKVLSTDKKTSGDTKIASETYSIVTNFGSAILDVNKNGNADLSGLSKYLEDPVYELIDHYNIQNSIEKIVVNKPEEKYSIFLTETAQTISDDIFEIPASYVPFVIESK